MWYFSSKSDLDKLEKLNGQALESVFQDKNKDYQSLLMMANRITLSNRKLQNIALLVYKALNNLAPSCIKDLCFYVPHHMILGGSYLLSLPKWNNIIRT